MGYGIISNGFQWVCYCYLEAIAKCHLLFESAIINEHDSCRYLRGPTNLLPM